MHVMQNPFLLPSPEGTDVINGQPHCFSKKISQKFKNLLSKSLHKLEQVRWERDFQLLTRLNKFSQIR
jgi:hypothetical protein